MAQLIALLQDIDPLAETVPPRHAIESDEEDEYNPLPTRGTPLDHVFEIKFIPDNLREGEHLVIAAGDIAKYWAHGADLGEQIGAIYGNKVSIGLVFNPKWTKSTVIVSEVLARLPVWAMHSYVTAILDALKPIKYAGLIVTNLLVVVINAPTRLALLDTYPTHAYISDKPVSFEDAPIRYLATQSAGNLLVRQIDRERE
ncbi:hypothetical protein H0H92_006862 [Tricholoma furcatifolium]|nr:hypothetical protein H0H92_006862 [Tricholoma furcatifolium]